VQFLGYIPREQIASHYAGAHVFVLPSYHEGMSVASLEAIAAGLAVVLTRTGGTVELVQEGVNGLVFEWGDLDTLTAHLQRLATDRELTRRMGLASRARAEMFSWDAAANLYRELLEQVAHPDWKEG
jgi:glycosyltransferase involved in cell wall biosynthesis